MGSSTFNVAVAFSEKSVAPVTEWRTYPRWTYHFLSWTAHSLTLSGLMTEPRRPDRCAADRTTFSGKTSLWGAMTAWILMVVGSISSSLGDDFCFVRGLMLSTFSLRFWKASDQYILAVWRDDLPPAITLLVLDFDFALALAVLPPRTCTSATMAES